MPQKLLLDKETSLVLYIKYERRCWEAPCIIYRALFKLTWLSSPSIAYLTHIFKSLDTLFPTDDDSMSSICRNVCNTPVGTLFRICDITDTRLAADLLKRGYT